MAQWIIQRGDQQYPARDLSELRQMAATGRLSEADLIQPPGAVDWLYASEIPELKGHFRKSNSFDAVDYAPPPQEKSKLPLAAALGVLILGGIGAAWYFAKQIPDKDQLELLGENALALTELLVTQPDAPVYDRPDGATVATLAKDAEVSMLGKRGLWYHVKTEAGVDGYVKADHVIPGYYFADSYTKEDLDPLYNPDRYVFVKNSSWLQLDQRNEKLTVFQFLLQNKSKFVMTDLVLTATIKDKSGKVMEQVEIPLEGTIPRYEAVTVGTINPEKRGDPKRIMTSSLFTQLSQADADLSLNWSDGVEVVMKATGFEEASIEILEVRAVPDEKATQKD